MTATRLVITGTWVTETDTPASGRIQFQANDVGFVNGGELVRAGVQGYALDKTGSINVSLIRCPDGYTVTEQINGAYKRSYILPDQVGPVDLRDVVAVPIGVVPATQASLNAEIATRVAADATEATTRGTNDTALAALISAEATARASGDSAGAAALAAAIAALSGTYVGIAGHASDSIPVASGGTTIADLTVAASRIIGRKATGGVGALTVAEVVTLLAVYTSAQTDSAIATAIANLVASSPGTLDTLNELAAALGNDPNFATTITTLIGTKAPIASPTFTGVATSPVLSATGITGATAGGRFVGATASGAPASGTFAIRDFVVDATGKIWVCTVAGTPGTWVQVGAAASAATTAALGTVKLLSPPRDGESPVMEIRRLTGDRWVPRRTITTNFTGDTAKTTTGVASTGVFTSTGHGYAPGDMVTFVLTSGGSGLTAGLPYYVITTNFAANTFSVATQPAGTLLTFSSDLTSGTATRRGDGQLFDFIDRATGATAANMLFTTSASRPALRAADGGTATMAAFFTKESSFRNWDVRLRYRPANDTLTSTTDYGPHVVAGWTDPSNNWTATMVHASGNPNLAVAATVNGAASTALAVVLPASPLSTSQDRVLRIRKEGDRICCKDWATNVVEPDWQREQRVRPPAGGPNPSTTTDNPERGVFGVRGLFMGAYLLEFAVTELERESENLIHNSDFTRIDTAMSTDTPKAVTGVASTGVFTTTAVHGLAVDDLVVFSGFTGLTSPGRGIVSYRDYYVVAVPTTTTFTVAATRGGAAITFLSDITSTGAYVMRNPIPSGWTRSSTALLTGNRLEVNHVAGPDGSTRPALRIVCVTPNDPNLNWYQYLYNPFNSSGAGSFGNRLNPHPQCVPARRIEFSAWVKGSVSAIQAGGLGVTFDVYMYDNTAQLMMDRQTYHPGLSPSTTVDSGDPASYGGAQVVSTFGWTHLRSIMEISQYQAVQQMRCQILLHEATDTADVLVMDPCMRAVG